jgi:hypothetical protein
MAPTKRTLWASRLKLAAILSIMLLVPALAVLVLDDWNGLWQEGGALLVVYLLVISWLAYHCGTMLYRLATLSASPVRHSIDYLLAGFCVADSGLASLTASHPHDAMRVSDFLTFTLLAVAVSLGGLYWPLDPQPLPTIASRSRLPRRLRRGFAVLFAVAPLPLAIWLTRIDWLHSTRGSLDYNLPEIVNLSLLVSVQMGLRWADRIPARPSRKAPAEADMATQVADPLESAKAAVGVASHHDSPDAAAAQGMWGVLVSRTCTTGYWSMDGELWLFPDGLLRIPLGGLKTLAYVGNSYNPGHPLTRTFDTGDFLRATTDPRNLWIPRTNIADAALSIGVVFGRLRVTLNDGRSLRLQWLSPYATYMLLHEALQEWLGERLEVPAAMAPRR